MSFTRNLKLRLSEELTSDARFNLRRIDQAFATLPLGSGATQSIKSSGDIVLEPDAISSGGSGKGTVRAPKLKLSESLQIESGAYTFTINTGTQSENLTITLPITQGEENQTLTNDGSGNLSWSDPPNTNLSTLSDVTFTSLSNGQLLQYNGSKWVNATLPSTRQTDLLTWLPIEGNEKTIVHGFNTKNIQVWIYEEATNNQVFVDSIDFTDLNTIVIKSHKAPQNAYSVSLIQTI